MRIVAIEEHHVLPAQRAAFDTSRLRPGVRERMFATLDQRLADMDAAGIEQQVLSVPLQIPQSLPTEAVTAMATAANSDLHTMVETHPDRFAAFAALPCTSPDEAARELERTVTQLGFVGAMICGTIAGRFLDDPMFSPILEAAARLNVALYLHPGPPPKAVADAYYSGFDAAINQTLSNAGYGWHYEESLHAVRLIVSGAFDRLPGLKVILGHLGEGIPFHLERIDELLTPLTPTLQKPINRYFRDHFWITTSGYFYDGPFKLTREVFGDDRLIFSVDYPFADNRRARDWFDRLELAADVREKVAYATADALLGLHR